MGLWARCTQSWRSGGSPQGAEVRGEAYPCAGGTALLLAVLGVSYVAQLVPALLFSLMSNHFATKWGAGAGILVGVAIVTYLTVTGLTLRAIFPTLGSLGDINVGVIALLANVVVVAVSPATRTSTAAGRAGGSPDPTLKA